MKEFYKLLNFVFTWALINGLAQNKILYNEVESCESPVTNREVYRTRSRVLQCDRNTVYHCIDNGTARIELCHILIKCNKGQFLTLSGDHVFKCENCPVGTYFLHERESVNALRCEDKSSCDSHYNEEVCEDGGPDVDRTCKCMYKKNYAMLFEPGHPHKKCCSRSTDHGCVCEKKECDGSKELNSTYDCVEPCGEGYQREEYQNGRPDRCLPIRNIVHNATVPSDETPENEIPVHVVPQADGHTRTTESETARSTTPKPELDRGDNNDLILGLSVGIGVPALIVFIGIVIFFIWKRWRKRRKRRSPHSDDSRELQSLGENHSTAAAAAAPQVHIYGKVNIINAKQVQTGGGSTMNRGAGAEELENSADEGSSAEDEVSEEDANAR
ncbi:hypothetical protein ScPMuIL_014005 [Solemya velum]